MPDEIPVRFFKSLHFVSPVAHKVSLVQKKLKKPDQFVSVKATVFKLFTKPTTFDL